MSGQWWESNLIVGPFSNIAEANAWAAANPSSLFPGLLATSNGQQISWGAAGWGAPPGAWVYVGATLPALGAYIGQLIQVDNAAVPGGRSILRWNGTIWAPPAGELIASAWRGSSPVALVTPGAVAVTKIWESEIIPDYMIPSMLAMEMFGMAAAYNASGVPGCVLGFSLNNAVPSGASVFGYFLSASVTPPPFGAGVNSSIRAKLQRNGAFVYNNGDGSSFSGGHLQSSTTGAFSSNAMRLYLMAKPSGIADQINMSGVSLVSVGNL